MSEPMSASDADKWLEDPRIKAISNPQMAGLLRRALESVCELHDEVVESAERLEDCEGEADELKSELTEMERKYKGATPVRSGRDAYQKWCDALHVHGEDLPGWHDLDDDTQFRWTDLAGGVR